MRKISSIFLIIILMISVLSIKSYSTTPSENTEDTSQAETSNEVVQQPNDGEQNGGEQNSGEQISEEQDLGDNQEQSVLAKDIVPVETIGRVIKTSEIKEVENGNFTDKIQEVTIEIIKGDYIGEEYTTNYNLSYDIEGKIEAYELEVGDKVTVEIIEENGNVSVTVQDVARSGYIIWMFIIFLLSIIVVGGKRGIKAIIGLLLTIFFIYIILVKNVFMGKSAVGYAIGTALIVIAATFVVIGGINKKILTATIGTLGGVITAGGIAFLFNNLAKMTGACEDAIQLSVNMVNISFNFRDLLLAGIIVSSLGACMDVGMSIASSLDEIKIKNPEITWKELFKSGMNIGKDVIGTMTNTLILAYVGNSITLILLFMACNMKVLDILNKETIAEQIISALAGSMGVVYTVPITSFVYSILNKDKTVYKKESENRINGKRSLKI